MIKSSLFRKMIACVAVISVIFNGVPQFASAETNPIKHDVNRDGVEETFEEWTSATSLPNVEGNYYLSSDVDLETTHVINCNKVVSIDLCGHDITMKGEVVNGNTVKGTVIQVINEGTVLNLYDSKDAFGEVGKITGGVGNSYVNINTSEAISDGGGIAIKKGATLNMYGGSVSGNEAGEDKDDQSSGGGVMVFNKCTFNMYAGEICNNNAVYGGGVFCYGTFNMYGGSIYGNNAYDGGGVSVYEYEESANDEEFTTTILITGDSIIKENVASYGGGFGFSGGKITIEGNSIVCENTAESGAGIYSMGYWSDCNLNIRGNAKIANNEAYYYGGGIYNDVANLELGGNAAVSENKAQYDGGGILNFGSNLVMKDYSTIKANSGRYGGGIFNFEFEDDDNDPTTVNYIYDSVVKVEENASVSENTCAYNGAGIYSDSIVYIKGKVSGNQAGYHGGGIYNDGGILELTGNAIVSENEATMDGGGLCNYGATLNTKDSVVVKDNYAGGYGGGICNIKYDEDGNTETTNDVTESVLSIEENVTVIGNQTNGYGGGIFNNSNADIKGKINNNYAKYDGGGIYNGGVLNVIDKGEIAGNTCDEYGGGVFNCLSFRLEGNAIVKDNIAKKFAGGVLNADKMYISGEIEIFDNLVGTEGNYRDGNLTHCERDYISKNGQVIKLFDYTLIIEGELRNTHPIGVSVYNIDSSADEYKLEESDAGNTSKNDDVVGIGADGTDVTGGWLVTNTGYKTYNSDDVANVHFKSEDPNRIILISKDGEVYLKLHSHEWDYTAKGNTVTALCGNDDNVNCEYRTQGVVLKIDADDMTYKGTQYDKVSVDNKITEVTGVITGEIYYEGTGSTEYANTTISPTHPGTYKATITIGGKNAVDEFEILKREFTVKYIVDGTVITELKVKEGENVVNIPSIPTKEGYDDVKPTWNHDGQNITDDTEINAIYIKNKKGEYKDITQEKNVDRGNIEDKFEDLVDKIPWKLEDMKKLEDGEDIKILINVTDEDEKLIDDNVKKIIEGLPNYIIGTIFRLDIIIQIGEEPEKEITKLKDNVTIRIQIPDDLINEDNTIKREYKVVQLDGGKIHDTKYDENSKTITIETDELSDCVIVYEDIILDAPEATPGIIDAPVAGDVINVTIWCAILLVTAVVLVYAKYGVKSEKYFIIY